MCQVLDHLMWPVATLGSRAYRAQPPVNPEITSCCCCSVAQLCLTLCDPMDCSTPGFLVLHHLLKLAQAHVHWVGDGQGSLACYSPWGRKESGTWLIDWTELNWRNGIMKSVPENIYLKTCSASFPGAHSGSPPWFLFRVWKIGSCSSTGFSLCSCYCC